VVTYQHYVQGLTFYGQRRTVMVGSWGELDFGSKQGDQSAFFWKTDADLLRAWASDTRLFLVINRSELDPLRAQLHPTPRQIAACGKKVLVVNFPRSLSDLRIQSDPTGAARRTYAGAQPPSA